ncbi:MAG: hypothetical protein ACI9XO_000094 [Paraglaciecola sp.]|jgi:hypothetical protein
MKSTILYLFLFLSSNCFAQDFYITTAGNDSNSGSEAQPWATLQHAANTLLPGQTVYIKTGTYFQETWVNVSGTAGNYITFTNFNNDQVIIDGDSDDSNQTELFVIFGQNYLKVDGLHFTNSTGNFSSGIYITNGSSNLEITNNQISNIHFSNDPNATVNSSTNVNPFVVYNENPTVACSNILVQNNEIFDCRTGFSEALTLSGNVDNFEISNNTVHDISNIGIDIAGGYGVSTEPMTDMARNGVVKENTVYNCVSAYAVSAGIYVDGGQDVVIERNTCYGNGRGFEIGCEENGHITTNVIVRDNIAYQNLESGIGIGGYNFPTTGKVTNS